MKSLGLQEILERLATAIVDLQAVCRNKVCRHQSINDKPGPLILDMLRPELLRLASHYFPDTDDVDEQFCLGVLWGETNRCMAWWHGLDGPAKGVTT